MPSIVGTRRAVLGIDPAWSENHPSGVALLREDPPGWECVFVAPSYETFLGQGGSSGSAFSTRPSLSRPNPAALLVAAREKLNGGEISVVAVDLPVARVPITGRRPADQKIAKAFGRSWCSTHSPNQERPGKIGTLISDGFASAGFDLAVEGTKAGTANKLVEVYPHTALLGLLDVEKRIGYKVATSKKWCGQKDRTTRITRILQSFEEILKKLRDTIRNISFQLPLHTDSLHLADLKRFEDAIDALVSAWVGIEYLEGRAQAFGDENAAIWVPDLATERISRAEAQPEGNVSARLKPRSFKAERSDDCRN